MAVANTTDILLESGTNELELMEFTVGSGLFGINVSKVQEILKYTPVRPMQNAHPAIKGIFKPRDKVITIIDLPKYLGFDPPEDLERSIFIITHFNNFVFGFHVYSVVGIDRVSWTSIQKPDPIIYGGEDGSATGIAEHQNRLITILDFEKIVAEISPQTTIKPEELDVLGPRVRREHPILIAEDSMLLAKLQLDSLHRAGYVNTIKADNGKEAFDLLAEIKESGDPVKSRVACVITDIEMPQMDGMRLTRLMKQDPVLKEIPVVLFSSLISEEMRLKGHQVGADAQITKPEIAKLVSVVDNLLGLA